MPDYKNAIERPTSVKNRRLKMSPAGVITLPVAARKALGMFKGQGTQVSVAVDDGAVIVMTVGESGGFRVSKGGQMALRQEARETLARGTRSHYWIELLDEKRQIRLHPFA